MGVPDPYEYYYCKTFVNGIIDIKMSRPLTSISFISRSPFVSAILAASSKHTAATCFRLFLQMRF